MRRRVVAVCVTSGLLVTGGCAGGSGAEPENDSPSTSQSQATTSPGESPAAQETGSSAPMEDLSQSNREPKGEAPTWNEEAAAEAAARAEAFMRAFARPELGADEWYAGVAGFLTDEAKKLFTHVDPSSVPASEVTGEIEVQENQAPTLAEVHVGTDAGVYLVTLTRVVADDPWMVSYAEPVE